MLKHAVDLYFTRKIVVVWAMPMYPQASTFDGAYAEIRLSNAQIGPVYDWMNSKRDRPGVKHETNLNAFMMTTR